LLAFFFAYHGERLTKSAYLDKRVDGKILLAASGGTFYVLSNLPFRPYIYRNLLRGLPKKQTNRF